VARVTGSESSPSISKVLERAAYASTEEIEAALTELLAPPDALGRRAASNR
jgi:2-oxoisovalerate dehydrogenase E1 component